MINEKKSELKVIWVALAILGCQALGIDISILAPLLQDPDSLLTAVQTAHKDGQISGTGVIIISAVYTIARSWLKGRH